MSGMLFFLFVQSLFQFGAKAWKWDGYYVEKNYLDMSFIPYHVRAIDKVSFYKKAKKSERGNIALKSLGQDLWSNPSNFGVF